MKSDEFRIFLSSTFRDLMPEREQLVKKVFPQIRALCRERGVEFTEIDLRWGITDEEARTGKMVRICMEEIDRCRPYLRTISPILTRLECSLDKYLLSDHSRIQTHRILMQAGESLLPEKAPPKK